GPMGGLRYRLEAATSSLSGKAARALSAARTCPAGSFKLLPRPMAARTRSIICPCSLGGRWRPAPAPSTAPAWCRLLRPAPPLFVGTGLERGPPIGALLLHLADLGAQQHEIVGGPEARVAQQAASATPAATRQPQL